MHKFFLHLAFQCKYNEAIAVIVSVFLDNTTRLEVISSTIKNHPALLPNKACIADFIGWI
jgi:hypothetical protein